MKTDRYDCYCAWAGVLLGSVLATMPAAARAQTRAGTTITNVATLTVAGRDGPVAVRSNAATVCVDERLDVVLRLAGSPTGDGPVSIPFVLTNAGTGTEAFALSATAGEQKIRQIRVSDGSANPAATPPLAPNESVTVLVLLDAAPSAGMTLTARAVTGSGSPGTLFAGSGDGGGDAVVGATGAAASVTWMPGQGDRAPSLVKSASVRAPDGSARVMAGAVVTYTLQATFPASIAQATISDPIPAGTRYVAGSLRLEGAALTDAADADAGRGDEAGISVALGPLDAAATRTVIFQVTIQ